METLRRGARGFQVQLLQRLLNCRLIPRPGLVEDQVFGPLTEAAIRRFQGQARGLAVDGVVGPNTWRALGITIDIDHRVRHIQQSAPQNCWSAAMTMATGGTFSAGPGAGSTYIFGRRAGSLREDQENVQRFAGSYGFTPSSPQSRPLATFADWIRRSPLILLGEHGTNPDGTVRRHALVISGMVGDGDPERTFFLIHDPALPAHAGGVFHRAFDDHVNFFPLTAYCILHR
jgi:peptidoglycan hydrolase-like protein with peptidoglycan-binding domain